jgi:diacylglycerol kinase (ATP)
MMRRRFFLIFNAAAGTSRSAFVNDVTRRLEAAGAVVTRSMAASAADARQDGAAAASSGHYDALIACGGDGTIRQAAAAAADTGCPVGCVMLGTGNVLAHELGLPRRPAAVADMLLHGPLTSIRLGRANADPFLLMAGIGLDGRIISLLDHGMKRRIAKAAFVPATLKALAAPLDRLTVEIDGHAHDDVTWAIITQANRYGGAFQITRRTHVRDGRLFAVLFRANSKTALVRQAIMLARGRLDDLALEPDSGVSIISCTGARVTSVVPVPVQLDGDDFGITPLVVTHDGGQVQIIVPTETKKP